MFITVSAGGYRSGGLPTYFGEFFIFSATGLEDSIGRRVYVHHHMSAGGAEEVFKLAKAHAIAELIDQISKRLALSDSVRFDDGLSIEDADWDHVAVLYRAGILSRKLLQDIENKTKSLFVAKVVREVLNRTAVQFEDAQIR